MYARREAPAIETRRASLARRLEAVGDIRRRDYTRARLLQDRERPQRLAIVKPISPGQDAA